MHPLTHHLVHLVMHLLRQQTLNNHLHPVVFVGNVAFKSMGPSNAPSNAPSHDSAPSTDTDVHFNHLPPRRGVLVDVAFKGVSVEPDFEDIEASYGKTVSHN